MTDKTVDHRRRRFLVASAAVVGAVSVVAVWPFLDSLSPSAEALALGAPVEIDISKVTAGQQVLFVWRNQPIAVVNRTPTMLSNLAKWDPRLSDPKCEQDQQPAYCKNEYRAIKPQFLVMILICTHLGCVPDYKPKFPDPSITSDWLGGYHCPCHGSKYDLSGRVLKGQPAPLNMVIPPYHYKTDTVVEVGVNPSDAELKKAAVKHA
ncbi:MAG TPA: ubiquinol-cytochrome c reductase iron-sulfur subunit [Nevskiaceae bacterium]|nr:ubiquinol-cytochrome c reductase iron-sulfur subunit [Nevskiaceae bacterium]